MMIYIHLLLVADTRSIKGWASEGTGVGREAPFHTNMN
jgi:hypothetical protein